MTLPSSGTIRLSDLVKEFNYQVNTFTSPGSGSIAIPAGCKWVILEAWGGGGSGSNGFYQILPGGGGTENYDGAGGGSGQYAYIKIPLNNDTGATISYTVGAGADGTVQSTSGFGTVFYYYTSGADSSVSVTVNAGACSLDAKGGNGALTVQAATGGSTIPGLGGGTSAGYPNNTGVGTAIGAGAYLITGNPGTGGGRRQYGVQEGGWSIVSDNLNLSTTRTSRSDYISGPWGVGGQGLGVGGTGSRAGTAGAVQITFLGLFAQMKLSDFRRKEPPTANSTDYGLVPQSLNNVNIAAFNSASTAQGYIGSCIPQATLKMSQFRNASIDATFVVNSGSSSGSWGVKANNFGSVTPNPGLYTEYIGSGGFTVAETALPVSRQGWGGTTNPMTNLYENQVSFPPFGTTNTLYFDTVAAAAAITAQPTFSLDTAGNSLVTYSGLDWGYEFLGDPSLSSWGFYASAPNTSTLTQNVYAIVTGCSPDKFNGVYNITASSGAGHATNTFVTLDYQADVSSSTITSFGTITFDRVPGLYSISFNGQTFYAADSTTGVRGAVTTPGRLSWAWTLSPTAPGTSSSGIDSSPVVTVTMS